MRNYKEENNTIIKKLKQGGLLESSAIASIIKENEGRVLNQIKKYNASQQEAQDVFIEGVTEVVFNIKNNRFRNDSPISNYLQKICKLIWFQKFRSKKVNHFNQHILAWWQEPIPGDCLHCDRLSVCSVGSRFPCPTHQIREKVSYSLNQIIILYSVEILSGWFCKVTILF